MGNFDTPELREKLFRKLLFHRLTKWSFTWGIALLPFIFLTYKQYTISGRVNTLELCSHGELFLLSIVMISEPLGMIVTTIGKNTLSMGFTLIIIFIIASSTYFFCLIQMNDVRVEECLKCMSNAKSGILLQINDIKETDSANVFTLKTNFVSTVADLKDDFLSRIRLASFVTTFWALLIGVMTITHIEIVVQRDKISKT